jgi:hypothetical protein
MYYGNSKITIIIIIIIVIIIMSAEPSHLLSLKSKRLHNYTKSRST